MTSPKLRQQALAGTLLGAMMFVLPACSSTPSHNAAGGSAAQPVAATSSPNPVKLAKTKFIANASLAAGATYQWIYKPFKAGTFKKGAKGRTAAFIKAGLAGTFAYNRLKAAINDAKGDPLLSKAVAPLTGSVDGLKALAAKMKSGKASDADFNQFNNTLNSVKSAGAGQGATVTNNVPSPSQIGAR
ncbi:hypothetical protein NGB36_19315 [Streptomyces sp. RB6PN25]|uniref:Lipoprotein n=1 Tax=Streptomyces humicola TaxID=2953240 RepID=A0ABT1PYF0_9ACTN|nr:hypothetical protein [Streptomyces humicola]MCQ4082696.1 hypothetical protein [Streptomyces humicola]